MTKPYKYILDDENNAIPVDDVYEWAAWYETAFDSDRMVVAQDKVGEERLSTVFLALTAPNLIDDTPILFETALFHADGAMEITGRYPTWEKAAECHELMLKVLRCTPEMAS